MKKVFVLITITFFCILLLPFSCKKEKDTINDDPSQQPVDTTPYFTAKVDGKLWKATAMSINSLCVSGLSYDTSIVIMKTVNSTGTYPLSGDGGFNTNLSSGNAGEIINYFITVNGGSLTISKYDETNKKCSGTFYFSAKNNTKTVQITEGKFNNIPIY